MRRIAYFIGGLMLFEGLWGTFDPRAGFKVWRQYLQPYLPHSMNRLYADYSQLSSGSLRYLYVWVAFMGVFILSLAKMVRPTAMDKES